METIITLVVAALSVLVIYNGLDAIFKVLPESGFRSFMLFNYGKVFTGFMSLSLLWVIYVYVMVGVLGIHC